MRMLVTGKNGQVARALLERGALAGIAVTALGRPELDLAAPEAGLDRIRAAAPDIIVSAAAYTAVDGAETEPTLAETVNGEAPGALAACAAQLGIPLIHISTDYVFDGLKPAPYLETDAPNPQGAYGTSKLHGEQAVAAATGNHAILRTAWVTSPWGHNFIKTMLRLAGTNPTVRVVADQLGNPTSAIALADAILRVARNLVEHPDDAALRGIFHAVGTGDASWADLAAETFRLSREYGGPSAEVIRITTAEYPTPARRPPNSRLDGRKLARIHGVTFSPWQVSLAETVYRLVKLPERAAS